MTNLNLFDIVAQSEKPPQKLTSAAQDDRVLPIVRIITTKGGAFRELGRDEDGKVKPTGREFFLIELEDGQILREFSDGSIEPPTVATTSILIDDAIRFGVFKEIEAK
jgi:hypothetical protein